MEFLYRNAKGESKRHRLAKGWKEEGQYIVGYSETDRALRTFLIWRVVTYYDGCENLLKNPLMTPPVKRVDTRSEILLTGFPSVQRRNLEQFANESGMKVVQSVTNGLSYLCVGPNAGPTKVDTARQRGLIILSTPMLYQLIETGEIPDHEPDFL